MGNSKTLAVARKHRRKRQAAKEKMHQHLESKSKTAQLPVLAVRFLQRHLRVAKRT